VSSPVLDPADLPLDALLEIARQHAPKPQDARAKVAIARLDVKGTEWWTWLVPSVTAHQGYDFLVDDILFVNGRSSGQRPCADR
jgi:hypothetical protein